MNLLAIGCARSIWLFQIYDWNTRGRSLVPICLALIDKYKFARYPKMEELDLQNGIKFERGAFISQSGDQLSVNLTVYNDGLVVDTLSSTAESDYFLEQMLGFLASDYGFPDYQTVIRKKAYASEVFVKLVYPEDSINPKLRSFANRISSLLPEQNIEFRPSINFVTDPGRAATSLAFRLEPATGFPFSENRYYSIAPVQTDVHLQLLKEFESAFLS